MSSQIIPCERILKSVIRYEVLLYYWLVVIQQLETKLGNSHFWLVLKQFQIEGKC